MQKINAAAFYKVTTNLQRLEVALRKQHEKTPDGIRSIEDRTLVEAIRAQARELQSSLLTLGTRQTSKSADRLIRTVNDDSFDYPVLASLLKEIHSRLKDELSDVTILALNPKEQEYFEPTVPLFGKDFETKFPTALFELDEAAKCMALARDTAAVFHLMRCMEIGIRTVAKSLGIPDPTGSDRNWGAILSKIKAAMDAKTKTSTWKTGDREIFESAYASLDATRVAWRNTTMHVENKYTSDEAEHIFVAMHGFMKELASRMDEQGQPVA
jgi:hypothetical protein